VIRKLIGLEAGPYVRALGAGLGPVPAMALGLFLLGQLTHDISIRLLQLGLFIAVALSIYWAYLRWVLGVRFKEIMPKRARGPAAAKADE
jgi:hypothetical protein